MRARARQAEEKKTRNKVVGTSHLNFGSLVILWGLRNISNDLLHIGLERGSEYWGSPFVL